ncbi:MAG: DUF504 domain-containing protein [Chromatiales bacterium]
MLPIQDLLNRIRWDPEFGRGVFTLGYYDRVEGRIIRVPFHHPHFDTADRFSFQIVDDHGEVHEIPLHRIKEVYKDGQRIWLREH